MRHQTGENLTPIKISKDRSETFLLRTGKKKEINKASAPIHCFFNELLQHGTEDDDDDDGAMTRVSAHQQPAEEFKKKWSRWTRRRRMRKVEEMMTVLARK